MLGLPKSTELSQQLPKTRVFAKFDLRSSQRDRFDEDVSRMAIVNVISPRTVPALPVGEKVESIYVLEVLLKKQDYDTRNIQLLSKLIPQNILFLLRYENKVQLAIFHTKLLTSEWGPEPEVNLSGLDLDAVWEGLVKTVGAIEVWRAILWRSRFIMMRPGRSCSSGLRPWRLNPEARSRPGDGWRCLKNYKN